NKEARILTNSSYIQQNVFFPSDWERRWPVLYRALTSYQRKGKNAHDDAPDALTGLAECAQGKLSTRTKRINGKGAMK
ncbi:MAG: phage terminase large subunit, partial [Clostridia bacterium]